MGRCRRCADSLEISLIWMIIAQHLMTKQFVEMPTDSGKEVLSTHRARVTFPSLVRLGWRFELVMTPSAAPGLWARSTISVWACLS